MKFKLLVISILVLAGGVALATLPTKQARFKTDFTITFSSLTLQEAAEKERVIRELFKDTSYTIKIIVSQEETLEWQGTYKLKQWQIDTVPDGQNWVPDTGTRWTPLMNELPMPPRSQWIFDDSTSSDRVKVKP
jgi:hypothetical protein